MYIMCVCVCVCVCVCAYNIHSCTPHVCMKPALLNASTLKPKTLNPQPSTLNPTPHAYTRH